MSYNPKNGRISSLCTHCGRWSDWVRNYGPDGKPEMSLGKKWRKPIVCFWCGREFHHPADPVKRHYAAAHDPKQKKLKGI